MVIFGVIIHLLPVIIWNIIGKIELTSLLTIETIYNRHETPAPL